VDFIVARLGDRSVMTGKCLDKDFYDLIVFYLVFLVVCKVWALV